MAAHEKWHENWHFCGIYFKIDKPTASTIIWKYIIVQYMELLFHLLK